MSSFSRAIVDLSESLRAWRLWSLLGWLEIRQRYSRSKLGPLWLTISMGVMVGTLGIVYGTLFGQKLGDYLPMIAVGLVVWNLFSSIVNEGSQAYMASANYIRQVRTPRLIYMLQVAWRNLVIFAHNFVIIVIVLLVFGVKSWAALPLAVPGLMLLVFGVKSWAALPLAVPGLMLLVLNALWIGALAGLISARFRDLPQIINALLQVAFYVTPILFSGEMLRGKHHWIVALNPIAYWVDAARQPLMGVMPSGLTWGLSIGTAVLGWALTLAFTGRYHKRIPYWV